MGTTAARQTPPAAAPEAAAPTEQAPRTRPRWLLPAVIAGTALAGAATAKFVVVPHLGPRSAAAAPAASDAKPIKLFHLDNLVVNPAGSQGTRFLMATVVLQSPDETTAALLAAHEVEARDRVTSMLAALPLDLLVSTLGRDSVKRLVVVALAPLVPQAAALRVYLPQYVIQ